MAQSVRVEIRDAVARVTIDALPGQMLGQAVRAGLLAAVQRAEGVGALVIGAAGRDFAAAPGAPLAPRDAPSLGEICLALEAFAKPVIVALHGAVLGAGLELALAGHFRIAHADARLGWPGVRLGLTPAAGGSQRLPRLIGPARALDMLLGGQVLAAAEAERIGLVDKVVTEQLDRAAFETARNMLAAGQKPRPTGKVKTGLRNPRGYLAEVAARRATVSGPSQAPAQMVDLVEAALLLPLTAGLAKEAATAATLRARPEAAALQRLAAAEARAAWQPRPGAAPPFREALLLGEGADAARIARACLSGGLPVRLGGRDGPGRLALRARIVADYTADVQAGRLAARARDTALAGLRSDDGPARLGADIVVLAAGAEAGDLAALRGAEGQGPLLALAAGPEVAEDWRASGAVIGLHMPAPAHETTLVELAPVGGAGDHAPAHDMRAEARARALVAQIGRQPLVLAQGQAGQVSGTLDAALFASAEVLALTGTNPAAIDTAWRAAGLPLGPFEKADRGWLTPVDPPGGASRLQARMQAAGWRGRAAGQGFYLYGPAGARQGVAPEVLALIGALREASRVPAATAPPTPEEIRQRGLLAMANAGARLLAAGVLARPSEVDVAAVHGLGLARELGGPMAAADRLGVLHARNLMRRWTGSGDLSMAVWHPAALFDAVIRSGGGFAALDG